MEIVEAHRKNLSSFLPLQLVIRSRRLYPDWKIESTFLLALFSYIYICKAAAVLFISLYLLGVLLWLWYSHSRVFRPSYHTC